MRMLGFFLSACLLLIGANTAFADGAPPDPKILMGGSGSCGTFHETSYTQTFTDVQTGCLVDFYNDIPGVTLDLLVVNVDTPFGGALDCALGSGTPLNTAFVSSPTSCTFEDVSEPPESIGPGGYFSLTFENDASGSFPASINITLAQTVIPTPEPATMLLLSVGLAGLLVARKRLKVAGSSIV